MTTGLRAIVPPGSRVFAATLVLTVIAGSQSARLMAQGLGGHITEAQRPEVYLQFGALGVGSDEGHIGTGASYGGTVELPIERRLVFDLDVQTSRVVLREWDRPSVRGEIYGVGWHLGARLGVGYRFGRR